MAEAQQEKEINPFNFKHTYEGFPKIPVISATHINSEPYPYIIACEGISAVGKSTGAANIIEVLQENGITVLSGHSPDLNLPGGEKIREMLATGGEEVRCSPQSISLFMDNQVKIDTIMRDQANKILESNPGEKIAIVLDRSPICGVVYSSLQDPANAQYYARYYGFIPRPKFYIHFTATDEDREKRWALRTKNRPWRTHQRYANQYAAIATNYENEDFLMVDTSALTKEECRNAVRTFGINNIIPKVQEGAQAHLEKKFVVSLINYQPTILSHEQMIQCSKNSV